jgi:hypothetical protein
MTPFHFSTFQLFEIESETLPLFDFSTFWLFDFSKLTMRPFHFSTFWLFDFSKFFLRTFRLKPCSVFFQPRPPKQFAVRGCEGFLMCVLLCVAVSALLRGCLECSSWSFRVSFPRWLDILCIACLFTALRRLTPFDSFCISNLLTRLSQKLAVASWSYSCSSKGRGRSQSNTGIFHSNPHRFSLPPKLPGHFEAVSEADGHGPISCQGRLSVTL